MHKVKQPNSHKGTMRKKRIEPLFFPNILQRMWSAICRTIVPRLRQSDRSSPRLIQLMQSWPINQMSLSSHPLSQSVPWPWHQHVQWNILVFSSLHYWTRMVTTLFQFFLRRSKRIFGWMSEKGPYILKASPTTPMGPQKNWTFRKFVQICHEMAQKWPKMTQSGPNMTSKGPKWPKNYPKCPKVVQIWPQMAPNGPTWS